MSLQFRHATFPSVEVAAGMPKRSPFEITLSADEQLELEARARKYRSSYLDVMRAKIILMAAQDLANDIIASRLDMPRQIVSKWRKRFCEQGFPGLEEEPRGAPARFSPQRRRRG
jgi:hypothetical protein